MEAYLTDVANFCSSKMIPILLVFLIFFASIYFVRKSKYYSELGYLFRALSDYIQNFEDSNTKK